MKDNLTIGKIIEVRTGDYKREWKPAKVTYLSKTFTGYDEDKKPIFGLSVGVDFIGEETSQYLADVFGFSSADWRFK